MPDDANIIYLIFINIFFSPSPFIYIYLYVQTYIVFKSLSVRVLFGCRRARFQGPGVSGQSETVRPTVYLYVYIYIYRNIFRTLTWRVVKNEFIDLLLQRSEGGRAATCYYRIDSVRGSGGVRRSDESCARAANETIAGRKS